MSRVRPPTCPYPVILLTHSCLLRLLAVRCDLTFPPARLLTCASRRPSDSVNTVASGLRELDKLVGERKGDKIVVKVMWDRGAIEQLWQYVIFRITDFDPELMAPVPSNHVTVEPKTWAPLGLPHPDEVPNLSIQVINFHRPLLGTFHQKAMVVDRKVALLNSNNIQDRPNLEVRSRPVQRFTRRVPRD